MEFVDKILTWFDLKTEFVLSADERGPAHEEQRDPNPKRGNGGPGQPMGLAGSRPETMISCLTCAHGTTARFRPGDDLCCCCLEALLSRIASDGDGTEKTVDKELVP